MRDKGSSRPMNMMALGICLNSHEHGVMRNTQAWLELTAACPPYVEHEASEVVSILYFFSSPRLRSE